MLKDELIAGCYRLREHIESDPGEFRTGLQGDIWDEYCQLIKRETETIDHIITLLARLN